MDDLDFEAVERQQNLENLSEMVEEVAQRSNRLATRIAHFAEQFDIASENFWHELDANPNGPLAAVLAREARRQNVHENAAAKYVSLLVNVDDFQKLPSVGPNAHYVNADGLVVTGQSLGTATHPSKSIDFRWQTGGVTCYAAQKYTKEGGGNQDNQFNELVRLLKNFLMRTNNNTALFILVDGPYYDDQRLGVLRQLTRNQAPRSYVTGINDLTILLEGIIVDNT